MIDNAVAARRVSDVYARAKNSDRATEERMREYALRFLPIVKSEVLRFKMRVPRHIELEELHGVAICGLMKAFDRYQQDGDDSFGAYVRKRVRGSILDELRRLDSLSRTARKKARLYDQTIQHIEQREGRLATQDEIQSELGLDEREFDQFLEDLRPITFFSIDEVRENGESDGISLSEKLEDPGDVIASEKMENSETLGLVRERLKQLPDVQQKILHMYYFKDFRLAEIASVFNLSEGRICQLHTQAIRSLRVTLQRQFRQEEAV
ncbi:MAG: FliA/WhiG family RNA polymerase sigma factor [Verrucomicrobiae bacterium]|nr:FliA/WhiG family RNA polymerase sigma factor [Verrucomicrobiae bacterium]